MTAEETVKRQYPEAVCLEFPAGATGRIYAVLVQIGKEIRVLGSGPTPEEAWRDAAERLKEGR